MSEPRLLNHERFVSRCHSQIHVTKSRLLQSVSNPVMSVLDRKVDSVSVKFTLVPMKATCVEQDCIRVADEYFIAADFEDLAESRRRSKEEWEGWCNAPKALLEQSAFGRLVLFVIMLPLIVVVFGGGILLSYLEVQVFQPRRLRRKHAEMAARIATAEVPRTKTVLALWGRHGLAGPSPRYAGAQRREIKERPYRSINASAKEECYARWLDILYGKDFRLGLNLEDRLRAIGRWQTSGLKEECEPDTHVLLRDRIDILVERLDAELPPYSSNDTRGIGA